MIAVKDEVAARRDKLSSFGEKRALVDSDAVVIITVISIKVICSRIIEKENAEVEVIVYQLTG